MLFAVIMMINVLHIYIGKKEYFIFVGRSISTSSPSAQGGTGLLKSVTEASPPQCRQVYGHDHAATVYVPF